MARAFQFVPAGRCSVGGQILTDSDRLRRSLPRGLPAARARSAGRAPDFLSPSSLFPSFYLFLFSLPVCARIPSFSLDWFDEARLSRCPLVGRSVWGCGAGCGFVLFRVLAGVAGVAVCVLVSALVFACVCWCRRATCFPLRGVPVDFPRG